MPPAERHPWREAALKQLPTVAWVLRGWTDRRRRQAKTWAERVAAARRGGRGRRAALGRQLRGPAAAQHRSQRTWRFGANRGVGVRDARPGRRRHLRKRRRPQRPGWQRRPRVKPLRIAFDWIDVRNFHPRMAAAVRKGRARPLLGTTYTQGKFTTSPNHREEGRLRLVRTLLPDPVPVILWADRGFGRTERARTGQQLGLRSAIRLQPDG